ncbi:YegS/Rv2252/BmrU family lipid kinase [Erysipelotrichaceae bacterium 66-17]
MKYVFIINGRAKGKNKELMSRIVSWAKTHDSTIHFTKYEKHATYIAKEYASDQNEPVHIFACGGDGLLHEVVNGIAGAAHVTLSVYPSGTGNDFIKSFPQYKREDFMDLSRYEEPVIMRCDLLKMGTEYSINTISFGFDVHVAQYANEFKKKMQFQGIVPYYLGMLKSLTLPLNETYQLQIDEKKLEKKDYAFLVLCNGRFYGGGYQPCPDAQINDGLMNVCMISGVRKYQIVRFSRAYEKGKHTAFTTIYEGAQAKVVHVNTENKIIYANMDGEVAGFRNPTVEVVPGAVQLALPSLK